jgi:hypothetical protein
MTTNSTVVDEKEAEQEKFRKGRELIDEIKRQFDELRQSDAPVLAQVHLLARNLETALTEGRIGPSDRIFTNALKTEIDEFAKAAEENLPPLPSIDELPASPSESHRATGEPTETEQPKAEPTEPSTPEEAPAGTTETEQTEATEQPTIAFQRPEQPAASAEKSATGSQGNLITSAKRTVVRKKALPQGKRTGKSFVPLRPSKPHTDVQPAATASSASTGAGDAGVPTRAFKRIPQPTASEAKTREFERPAETIAAMQPAPEPTEAPHVEPFPPTPSAAPKAASDSATGPATAEPAPLPQADESSAKEEKPAETVTEPAQAFAPPPAPEVDTARDNPTLELERVIPKAETSSVPAEKPNAAPQRHPRVIDEYRMPEPEFAVIWFELFDDTAASKRLDGEYVFPTKLLLSYYAKHCRDVSVQFGNMRRRIVRSVLFRELLARGKSVDAQCDEATSYIASAHLEDLKDYEIRADGCIIAEEDVVRRKALVDARKEAREQVRRAEGLSKAEQDRIAARISSRPPVNGNGTSVRPADTAPPQTAQGNASVPPPATPKSNPPPPAQASVPPQTPQGHASVPPPAPVQAQPSPTPQPQGAAAGTQAKSPWYTAAAQQGQGPASVPSPAKPKSDPPAQASKPTQSRPAIPPPAGPSTDVSPPAPGPIPQQPIPEFAGMRDVAPFPQKQRERAARATAKPGGVPLIWLLVVLTIIAVIGAKLKIYRFDFVTSSSEPKPAVTAIAPKKVVQPPSNGDCKTVKVGSPEHRQLNCSNGYIASYDGNVASLCNCKMRK